MKGLSDFIDVAFSYFDTSTKRKDEIMTAVSDVNAKIAELSAKVDVVMARFADEKAAIAAAAAAQKASDDAALSTDLDGVVANLAAVEAKVS